MPVEHRVGLPVEDARAERDVPAAGLRAGGQLERYPIGRALCQALDIAGVLREQGLQVGDHSRSGSTSRLDTRNASRAKSLVAQRLLRCYCRLQASNRWLHN